MKGAGWVIAWLAIGIFHGTRWLLAEELGNLILACFCFVMMRLEMLVIDAKERR